MLGLLRPATEFAPKATRLRPHLRAKRQGFSLPELVIVVLITGITAAVAMPKFVDSLQKYRVNNAADRVVGDLARAQSAAYAASTSRTVTFTVATSQYQLANVTSVDHPSGTYLVDLSQEPYNSKLVSVFGQTGTQTITFNGYGQPSTGGNIVVAAGKFQKTIVVDPTTGVAASQ